MMACKACQDQNSDSDSDSDSCNVTVIMYRHFVTVSNSDSGIIK